MSEVQSTRSIESSPILPLGGELLLEHAFKLHKGSAIVQKSSFPKGQLPGIFRTLESITTNPALLNILIGNPRLLAMVSKFPALLNILISNPALLAILESRPSLINLAIISPRILQLLAQRPGLLGLVSANPGLLSLLISNPSLLNLLASRPGLLGLIAKSPGLLTQLIANPDLLTNKNIHTQLIKPPVPKTFIPKGKEHIIEQVALKEPLVSKLPIKQVSMRIAKENVRFVENKILSNVQRLVNSTALSLRGLMMKLPPRVYRTFQYWQPFLTGIQKSIYAILPKQVLQKIIPNAVTEAQSKALNPALLSQLGTLAVGTSKGRVMPSSGTPEDWGIELETQTETQLRSLQELGPIQEIDKASEVTLMKETLS